MDNQQYKVFVFFSVFTRLIIAFEVTGTISLENTTDMATAMPGDSVIFSFDMQLNLDSGNEAILVTIAGDTLEFYNQTCIETVDWTLTDSTGMVSYARNDSALDTEESVFIPINNRGGLAYFLNITGGLSIGQWSFNGSYQMTITEDITLGSLIRSVITVTAVWTPYNASSRTLVSAYHVVPYPNITGAAKSNLTQGIMGLFTSQITVASTRDIGNYLVQCYTSLESTTNEARLTVQELKVTMNETYGTTPSKLQQLQYVRGSKSSTINSYQNNLGLMRLPVIPLDTGSHSELVVASQFTIRVEDYEALETGDQWPVYMGASFSGNIVWAGWINVNITAPEQSVPALTVALTQTQQCAYDGSLTRQIRVLVSHATESTGTAYSVTVNVYLPDYMTMVNRKYTEPRENQITVSQDGTVITSQITRLTFSDPFTLDVTLDFDLSNLGVLEASDRIITAESICNDRWGNVTDILSETAYISVDVDKICSKRLTWSSSSTCSCAYDPTRSDCGCCVDGACQCGAVRPHACAPCNEMWRCVEYKEGFENLWYLSSKKIRCDAYHMRRGSATGVSCHKILSTSPNKFLEISPRVAVVTGQSMETGYLYGIGNNGLVYVRSEDGGTTWGSISDEEYTNGTLESQFQWATLL